MEEYDQTLLSDEFDLPEKVFIYSKCNSTNTCHIAFISSDKKHIEDFVSKINGAEEKLEQLKKSDFKENRLSNNLYFVKAELPRGTEIPGNYAKFQELKERNFPWECQRELFHGVERFVYNFESELEKRRKLISTNSINRVCEKYAHSKEWTMRSMKKALRKTTRHKPDLSLILMDSTIPESVQEAIPHFNANYDAINAVFESGQIQLIPVPEFITLYELFKQSKNKEMYYLTKEDLLSPVVQQKAVEKTLSYLQSWEMYEMTNLKNLEKYVLTGRRKRYDAFKVLGSAFLSHLN